MNIVIFFSTDNNYAVPSYLALYSLLKNYKGTRLLEVYILVSEDFSKKNVALFERLSDTYVFLSVKIIKIEADRYQVPVRIQHITQATLYRFSIYRIAEEESIDKCIYLDSDLIVEGNIEELYDIDIEGYYVGGVIDWGQSCYDKEELKQILGVPTLKSYINAGVLLMNLKEMIADGIGEKMEEVGRSTSFPNNDQDVINSICFGKIKILPLKYNTMHIISLVKGAERKYGAENLKEAIENPFIVHYLSRKKPWKHKYDILADYWWKYAKMQDKEIYIEYIVPFVNANKLPLKISLPEMLKCFLRKIGVYGVIKKVYKKDRFA